MSLTPHFYEGYERSVEEVEEMDFAELLRLCDALHGRPDGWATMTLDRLRAEALEQHRREWTIPMQHRDYWRDNP